ncbi:Aste57867_18014 [Aphanomyces stellatus]|uniref:Aste57867_18014 protein n=1 Tax=Aphanomyces stellatus TaxID=120398 RepID=A0A485LAP1_9STRA|nr:hypothetical protein As57867_017952 [Aphanomyces stellatus]VFT94753.1 Aste57867_18014 [Aphanomyces stellatus]
MKLASSLIGALVLHSTVATTVEVTTTVDPIASFDDIVGLTLRSFLNFDRRAPARPTPAPLVFSQVYPDVLAFADVVDGINANIHARDLQTSLTTFVHAFQNRQYNSTEGIASAGWIYDHVHALASLRPDLTLSVRKFDHPWGQFSVIARVDPAPTARRHSDVLIVGAHQDSVNWADWKNEHLRAIAPGADDDGSGTITILESLKYLLTSATWHPTRPVEFHWYSGEEEGLLGSKAIAKDYAARKVPVYAQLQQDMTGWVNPDAPPTVTLIDDWTSPALNAFVVKVVDAYLDIPADFKTCGYACSDHASWFDAGFPSSFPYEDKADNPNVHSQRDTLATIDWEHVTQFAKLTVGFVVELTQA